MFGFVYASNLGFGFVCGLVARFVVECWFDSLACRLWLMWLLLNLHAVYVGFMCIGLYVVVGCSLICVYAGISLCSLVFGVDDLMWA